MIDLCWDDDPTKSGVLGISRVGGSRTAFKAGD
jgi:hypothetical protein